MKAMKISRQQFDTLVHLLDHTHDTLADALNTCAAQANQLCADLKDMGLISENMQVTALGLAALEPFRTRRVIFLAAGFGSRLRPATLNVPKPLVRVHGQPIICSAINAALAAGIEEIYIVRGYLGECFDILLRRYPQLHLIDNPDYETANNISSAMQVRHLMKNAYVMEADLLINNPAVFHKYNYTSNCLGVPVEKTDDWCVISENGIAKQLVKGGEKCHHLFSIYYMSSESGEKLPAQLEELFASPGGRDMFWDIAPMNRYNDAHHIEIRECKFADISEIDTYKELQALDSNYIMN